MAYSASCPVCSAQVNLADDVEESEVVTCPDCQTSLVVEQVSPQPSLVEAPQVDEDWGE